MAYRNRIIDDKVYSMPTDLELFMSRWWTVADAARHWEVDEKYAEIAFMGYYGDVEVYDVVCRYSFSVVAVPCIKAGSKIPRHLASLLGRKEP